MKVTVVIPNYNGEQFLRPCLDGLRAQEGAEMEVLVVENASQDRSLELLSEYPEVRVLAMAKNLGFAGGVNAGIRAARTPYVILLNNDTVPEPGYVKALTDAIESDPRIFSVSAKMVSMDRPDIMDDAGDMYSLPGWAFQRGVGQPAARYGEPCEVFTACAGAAIYRRSLLQKTGLFDENHFAYLEDVDVGWRARLLGYKNVYCPRAVVRHVGSGTSGSKYNDFKVRLTARNSLYVTWKNMPLWQRVLNAPALLAGHLVKQLFFIRRGFGRAYAQGLWEGLRTRSRLTRAYTANTPILRVLRIEGWLIRGTVLYVRDLIARRTGRA